MVQDSSYSLSEKSKQPQYSFTATAKVLSLTIIKHLGDGLLNAVTVPRRNTCVVTINCESDSG
jgi:hypothetical protein